MLLSCLSQCPSLELLFPLLLRAANGIFMITTVSWAHLSKWGCARNICDCSRRLSPYVMVSSLVAYFN